MERDLIRASLAWSAIGILANLSLVPALDNELSTHRLKAPVRRWIIIAGSLAVILLAGTLLFRESRDDSRAYRAESLLVVRPFNNALLRRAFEREVMRSSPGLTRLAFQVSTFSIQTPKGTTSETNGVIRLVAAGATAADAERLAKNASEGVRAALRQLYGAVATPVGQAHSAPTSAFHEPFRLRFGNATPGYFPTAGRVFFEKAAISIDPGQGWMRSYGAGREPGCDQELIGQGKFNGGFILAFQLRPLFTNLQSGVGELRPGVLSAQGLIESSYREEPFTTASGLIGMHVSFTQRYPSPFRGGMILMTQTTHYYLVTNAHSRCVCVQFVSASGSYARPKDTISESEAEEVQRMIQKSLRIQ